MELVEGGNSATLRTPSRDLWRPIVACLAWEDCSCLVGVVSSNAQLHSLLNPHYVLHVFDEQIIVLHFLVKYTLLAVCLCA